jgi:hypothetical protein
VLAAGHCGGGQERLSMGSIVLLRGWSFAGSTLASRQHIAHCQQVFVCSSGVCVAVAWQVQASGSIAGARR